MNVFISWSGERSKAVALALRVWLPDVFQSVKPWMSGVDIQAGARWSREVEDRLAESRFCIICLTKQNQAEPWLLFEAGAVARSVDDVFVCPYLIDLSPSEIDGGPLTLFQSKQATMDGTRDLMMTVNAARPVSDRLTDSQVVRVFDKWWPELDQKLRHLPDSESIVTVRDPIAIADETLTIAREIGRHITSIVSTFSKQTGVEARTIAASPVHHLRLVGDAGELELLLLELNTGAFGAKVGQQQRYSDGSAGVNLLATGTLDVSGMIEAAKARGLKVDIKFFGS